MKHIITTLILLFFCQFIFSQSTLHVPYRNDSLWGYANINGKIIVKPIFTEVDYEKHFNNRYYVELNKIGVIDSTGKILINTIYDKVISVPTYDYNYYIFKQNNQIAILDSNYKLYNNELYDSMNIIFIGKNTKHIILKKDKQFQIKDLSNNLIIDSINSFEEYYDGIVTFYKKKKYGLFTSYNNYLLEPIYDSIIVLDYFSDNKIVAFKKNKLFEIQDLNHHLIIDSLSSVFKVYRELVIFKKNNKYGLFDLDNSLLLEPKYDSIISLKSILDDEKYNFSKFKYSLYFKCKTFRYLTSDDYKDTLFVNAFKDIYVDTILPKINSEDDEIDEKVLIPNESIDGISNYRKIDYDIYKYDKNRYNAGEYVINGKSYILDKMHRSDAYYIADSATQQIAIYNPRKNSFVVPFSDSFKTEKHFGVIPYFYIYYINGKCGLFDYIKKNTLSEPIYDNIEYINTDTYLTYSANKIGLIYNNSDIEKILTFKPEYDEFEKIKNLRNNNTYYKLFVFKKNNRICLVGENNVKFYKDN